MALAHDDLFSLNNKVSLITGAASGLGRSMAIGLAEAGSDWMLVDVLVNSFLSCSIVLVGCWYAFQHPIDFASSWKNQ